MRTRRSVLIAAALGATLCVMPLAVQGEQLPEDAPASVEVHQPTSELPVVLPAEGAPTAGPRAATSLEVSNGGVEPSSVADGDASTAEGSGAEDAGDLGEDDASGAEGDLGAGGEPGTGATLGIQDEPGADNALGAEDAAGTGDSLGTQGGTDSSDALDVGGDSGSSDTLDTESAPGIGDDLGTQGDPGADDALGTGGDSGAGEALGTEEEPSAGNAPQEGDGTNPEAPGDEGALPKPPVVSVGFDAPYVVAGEQSVAVNASVAGFDEQPQLAYQVTLDGAVVEQGDLQGGVLSFMPQAPGAYEVCVTAAGVDGQVVVGEATLTVISPSDVLGVELTGVSAYGHVGSVPVAAQVVTSGGVGEEPPVVTYQVFADGVVVAQGTAGEQGVSYLPVQAGDHELVVSAVDALGQVAIAQVRVPVAVWDRASADAWLARMELVEPTGDWRDDLVALATTQLGYRESALDFVVDEFGYRQGYTVYGDLCGLEYGDWCAMFVEVCLRRAGVLAEDYPANPAVTRWRNDLVELGVYEEVAHDDQTKVVEGRIEGEYLPNPGDLVFFRRAGYEASAPQHIGIVVEVADGALETIEGNTVDGVARRSYALDDPWIVGYANTAQLMVRADAFPAEDLTIEVTVGGAPADVRVLEAEETEGAALAEVATAAVDDAAGEVEAEGGDEDETTQSGLTVEVAPASGGLAFRYASTIVQEWDPKTHTFVERACEPSWSVAAQGGDMVEVTNTSVVAVEVTAYAQLIGEFAHLGTTVGGEDQVSMVLPAGGSARFTVGIDGSVEGLAAGGAARIGTLHMEVTATTV